MARYIILATLLILFTACENEDINNNTKAVSLTCEKLTDTTDGKKTIKCTAVIPLNTNDAFRTITFNCSGGKFSGTGNKDTERIITILKGDSTAEIYWQMPATAGDYYISASIGTGTNIYKAEQKITLTDVSKVITLSSFPTNLSNIEANGKNTINFKAIIDPNVPESYKTITFRCTNGKFIGENGDAASTTRIKKVNEKGEAEVTWVVNNQAGKSYISASVGTGTDISKTEQEIDLKPAIPSFNMQVFDTDKILADGVSLLEVRITDAINLSSDNIIINANNNLSIVDAAGNVLKDGKIKLINGQGVAYLQMSQIIDNYFIKAQTENGDSFKNQSFIPKRAFGESIFLEPSSLYITKDKSDIELIATLKRKIGKVSIGTPILFEAFQDSLGVKKSIGGVFKNIANSFSLPTEDVTITYLVDRNKINYQFPLTIIATSFKNERNELISTKIDIRIEK